MFPKKNTHQSDNLSSKIWFNQKFIFGHRVCHMTKMHKKIGHCCLIRQLYDIIFQRCMAKRVKKIFYSIYLLKLWFLISWRPVNQFWNLLLSFKYEQSWGKAKHKISSSSVLWQTTFTIPERKFNKKTNVFCITLISNHKSETLLKRLIWTNYIF